MKYQNIKKAKLSRKVIAKAFGFKNLNSFVHSSANKRYMKGLDECLGLAFNIVGVSPIQYVMPVTLSNEDDSFERALDILETKKGRKMFRNNIYKRVAMKTNH